MKFSGSYTFQAPRQRVFHALLNPDALQSSIPGCEAAWYPDETHMKVRLLSPVPLPGLQGPYDITVCFPEQQEPGMLIIQAGRTGRIGGTISTITQINIFEGTKSSEDSLLTYDAQVTFEGPIAFIGNPLFIEIFKHALNTFFKNMNTSLAAVQYTEL